MEEQILTLLQQSLDPVQVAHASPQLMRITEDDGRFPAVFTALSYAIGADGLDVPVRQMGGVILKNQLDPHKKEHVKRWGEFRKTNSGEKELKYIWDGIESGQHEVSSMAAHVLARVAAFNAMYEQPMTQLIPKLINSASPPHSPLVREAAITTLGCICEQSEFLINDIFQHDSDILAVFVATTQPGEPTPLQVAGVKALSNAIMFLDMDNEDNMRAVFTTLFGAIHINNQDLTIAALDSLIQVAFNHYRCLPLFMQDAFVITSQVIISGTDTMAMWASEFWATIFEEEERIGDVDENDIEQNFAFAPGCAPHLVPLVLQRLDRRTTADLEMGDDFDIYAALINLLEKLSPVSHNSLHPLVLPYVQESVNSSDTVKVVNGAEVFAAVLENPEQGDIGPLFAQFVPVASRLLQDNNPFVRRAALRVFDRAYEHIEADHLHGLVDDRPDGALATIITILCNDPDPKTASAACQAVMSVALNYTPESNAEREQHNPLSTFFSTAVLSLWNAASSGDESRLLLTESCAGITALIQSASQDTLSFVEQLLRQALNILNDAMHGPTKAEQAGIAPGLFRASLASIVRECSDVLPQVSSEIGRASLSIFNLLLESPLTETHSAAWGMVGAVCSRSSPSDALSYITIIRSTVLERLTPARSLYGEEWSVVFQSTIEATAQTFVAIKGSTDEAALSYAGEVLGKAEVIVTDPELDDFLTDILKLYAFVIIAVGPQLSEQQWHGAVHVLQHCNLPESGLPQLGTILNACRQGRADWEGASEAIEELVAGDEEED